MPMLKLATYPIHRKRLNRASEEGKLYQVFVEKDAEFKPNQYNNFFDSMYTVYQPDAPYKWISMEFWGSRSGIRLYSWLSGGISKDFLQSNINSVHPAAEVVEVPKDSDYARFGRFYGKDVKVANLELDGHYLFNLAQSDGERGGADMMASLCAALDNLDDSEEVAVQFLLRPVNYRTVNTINAYYDLYRKYGSRPSKLHEPYAKLNPYLEVPKALWASLRVAFTGSAGGKEQHQSITSIQKKIEAGVYFDLTVRVVCAHSTFGKAGHRMATVLSAFAPATDKNRLRPYSNYKDKRVMKIFKIEDRAKFLKEFEARRIHTYPLENIVTPSELATLLHYPSKHIKGVVRLRAKKLPVPEGIHTYNSIKEAWADDAIVFGISDFRGRTKYLAFKDIQMLMQHLYCIGGTGSGKSYWLSFIALQVQKYAGLTFFDVKGDVVDDFLRHLPKSEWPRVVYIDLQDNFRYMPLNILRCRVKDVYDLAGMIVDVFLRVFSDGSIKEHSENVLRKAIIAVISTDPEGTMLEVYRMFTDEAYLDRTISALEAPVQYPDVLAYWKTYKGLKPSGRRPESSAILNKLAKITESKRPRYTLSQKENAVDWRKLMDEKAIILVNFCMGDNKDAVLEFFGSIFTSFIADATFSRSDTLRDARVPHLFIMDEFEIFAGQSLIQRFLELARSFGTGVVLAHQNTSQITDPAMWGTIADNTFTQVSLLIGDKSAPTVASMLAVTPDDLTSMDNTKTYKTGFARFKLLNPSPFTFVSPNMSTYFPQMTWEEVKQWKDNYKKKNYQHIDAIRDEIEARYALVQKNRITDDDSPRAHKGNAGKRLKRGEHDEKIING